MKKLISLLVLATILVTCASTRLSKEEREIRKLQIAEQVENSSYTIIAEQVSPMGGRTITLTGHYTLEIKGDSARAFLPFFGRAYTAPFGSDGGIKFDEKMEQYQAVENKKGDGWDIRFKVKTPENCNYTFFLTIFNNGSASFNVTSPQRSSVSFSGDLQL